jgi:cystathionine gamma-synthase
MKSSDAIAVPLVQTAAYTFKDSQQLIDFNEGTYESYEYGRYENPTVRALELKMMEPIIATSINTFCFCAKWSA